MAAKSSSLSHVYLLVLFLVLISGGLNGGELKAVKASGGQRTWCVAKPSSDEKTLLENIDYACSHVDCSIILRKGCPCSSPDNLMNHASIAMNLYYRANGCNKWNCDFKNSALLVITDPSYGNCIYQ